MSEKKAKDQDKQRPKWKRFVLVLAILAVLAGGVFTIAKINESTPPTSTPVAKFEEQEKRVGGEPQPAPGAKNAGHSNPAPPPFTVKLAGNAGYSLNDMGITSRDSETIRVEIANFNAHDPRGTFLYYNASPLGKTNPLGSVNELVEGGVVKDGARYSQKGIDAYNAWKALWERKGPKCQTEIKVVDKVKHLGFNTGVTGPDSVTYSRGVYGNDLGGIDVTYCNPETGVVEAEHSVLFRCMQPTFSDVPPGPKPGPTDNTKALRTVSAGNPPPPEKPETPCVDEPNGKKCKPTPPEEPCKDKPGDKPCKPEEPTCEDTPENPECPEPEEKKVPRCDTKTKKVVEVTPKEAEDTDRYKPVGDKACKEPEEPKEKQVCNPETGEIITVPESEAHKYEPVDSPKCKTTEPEMVERCDTETKKVVSLTKEAADANPGRYKPIGSPECKTTHDECPELEGDQPEGTECEPPVELCPPGTDREGQPRGDKPCKTEPGTPNDGAEQQPVDENNPDDVKPTPGLGTPCSGSSCGHDPTPSGTEVEDSTDGGKAPGGDAVSPGEQPGNGDNNPKPNPDHSGNPTTNPDHGTGGNPDTGEGPADTPAQGGEANEGDPLDLFSTAKAEKSVKTLKAEPKKKAETTKVSKTEVKKVESEKKTEKPDNTQTAKVEKKSDNGKANNKVESKSSYELAA